MNVMWYTGKFDEACWQFLSMLGLTPSRFAHDRTGVAAVEQRIQYQRELRAGDTVTIRSVLLDVSGKSIRMMHEMRAHAIDEVAATTEIVGVHIDSIARKAVRLPDDVRERAQQLKEAALSGIKDWWVSR
jgi:acyl-CoA thioester hydrolase